MSQVASMRPLCQELLVGAGLCLGSPLRPHCIAARSKGLQLAVWAGGGESGPGITTSGKEGDGGGTPEEMRCVQV